MSRNFQLLLKHVADRVVAALLLVLLLPMFLLIGLLIKLDDRGPVFFRQARLGQHGLEFRIWKFRTMVPNADTLLDDCGRVVANRVTRVGRVLRSWSLDELPQLINILCGDMSFIGPRPALVEHLRRYSKKQRMRLLMRPGVSGLAQVNGRNRLPWSKRIAFDVEYIERFSIWLDLRILMRSVAVVLKREGIVLDRNPEHADDLSQSDDFGEGKSSVSSWKSQFEGDAAGNYVDRP